MAYLKPIKGRLLIAEPSILNDSSFNRAIILITEHTENNSVGFIFHDISNINPVNGYCTLISKHI